MYFQQDWKSKVFILSLFCIFFTECSAEHRAKRFNKNAAKEESKPKEIIKALNIKSDMVIADLGAGGGYFTLRFAKKLDQRGRVYAIDVNKDFLGFIKKEAQKQNIQNVTTVLVEKDGGNLPKSEFDLIFSRSVYHHLKNRSEYFENLSKNLKPEGRIAIIDYKPMGTMSFTDVFGHNTPRDTIVKEMQNAGYTLVEEHKFLPKQSFTIYQKK